MRRQVAAHRADPGPAPSAADHHRLRHLVLLPPRGPRAAAGHVRPGRAARLPARLLDAWLPRLGGGDGRPRARRCSTSGWRDGWAGLYEVTPDHNALIGEAASPVELPVRHRLLRPRVPAGPGRRRGGPRPLPRPDPVRRRRPAVRRPLPPGKGSARTQHRLTWASRRGDGPAASEGSTGSFAGRPAVRLSEEDRALLAGAEGPAGQLAMRIIVELARLAGAAELIDVTSAHIDGCLYHGQAGLDFAERLLRRGAACGCRRRSTSARSTCSTPTASGATRRRPPRRRRLMDAYVATGLPRRPGPARPTSCPTGPASASTSPGPSRTRSSSPTRCWAPAPHRYGDFIDICARAHRPRPDRRPAPRPSARRGQWSSTCAGLPTGCSSQDLLYPLSATWSGRDAASASR